MFYFFLQLWNTLNTHKIYIFELFVLYAWIVYFVKFYHARKYKPYLNEFKDTVSVIIPVLKENPEVFEKCLKSIQDQKPDELIVVLDKFETDPKLQKIAEKYARVLKADKEGKREAVSIGIRESSSNIVLLADSDTFFEKNAIIEMVKPFVDPAVGGVTSKQKVFNQKGNVIRRIAAWMEDVRFSIGSIPCQGKFEYIGCLPGRAIAFRRSYMLKIMDDFLNETFMGKKCNSGDDRFLTSLMLKNNWKTVYQSTALVYTDCPDTISTLIKQQLRWARSSQRETMASLGWIWKYPMTAFVFITDILTPFLFVAVLGDSILRMIIGETYFDIPFAVSLIMAFAGMNFTLGLKQFPHIDILKKDLPYLPIYVLFMTFIMTPIRIIGFLTMGNSTWMTRTT